MTITKKIVETAVEEIRQAVPEYRSEGTFRQNTALSYAGVLRQIENDLCAIVQWADMGAFTTAAEYAAKAEALIELLEVYNCGSTGGFDEGQQAPRTLVTRWRWLVDHAPKARKRKRSTQPNK